MAVVHLDLSHLMARAVRAFELGVITDYQLEDLASWVASEVTIRDERVEAKINSLEEKKNENHQPHPT